MKSGRVAKGIFGTAAVCVLLVFSMSCAGGTAWGESAYEELLHRYEQRMAGREKILPAKELILSFARSASPEERWTALEEAFRSDDGRAALKGPFSMEIAAEALALVESLFPEGDPGKWDAVSGFWNSREIPKSLAAVDAVFWAAASLLREGAPPGAVWLAFWLLDRFAASTRATFFFLSTCPVEADLLLREMTSRNLVPPRGSWGERRVLGKQPLAVPLRGLVSSETAVGRGMVFLDGFGCPASSGPFAWDREKGRLYRVLESDGPRLFIPLR